MIDKELSITLHEGFRTRWTSLNSYERRPRADQSEDAVLPGSARKLYRSQF